MLLTVSPFYHYNRANYDGDPNDTPISTTQHRGSQYAGAQIAFSAVTDAPQRAARAFTASGSMTTNRST